MAKLNNISTKTPFPALFLDSDVIINWLTKEESLWEAPYKILKLIEKGQLKGISTLINLLEVRFVLRRKKNKCFS